MNEAIGFLTHLADTEDRDAELFEALICTGLRKGERLALRGSDLELTARIAQVRRLLSSVDNSRLIFTALKTRTSGGAERTYQDHGLIFARENGMPLRPERMLRRFRARTVATGLPRMCVYDLRHLAGSGFAARVPPPIVIKTLCHSIVSITFDVYSHMTAKVTREAVDVMAAALGAAEAEARTTRWAHDALTDAPVSTSDVLTHSMSHSS